MVANRICVFLPILPIDPKDTIGYDTKICVVDELVQLVDASMKQRRRHRT